MHLRPTAIAIGACVAIGAYALRDPDAAAPAPRRSAAAPRSAAIPARPFLAARRTAAVEVREPAPVVEAVHGLEPLEDPADFAMVFRVGDVTYLQLSLDERATSHGRRHMSEDDGVISVVARVSPSAVPDDLRAWDGRTVVVDGTCRAKVVGFAEVSRVTGEPPYNGEEDDDGEGERHWTIEAVTNENVTLAAELDDCDGTWARRDDHSEAAVVTAVDEPDLERAALADLLALRWADPVQQKWADSGGEGDWRDVVDVTALTYRHPWTEERWIVAKALHPGECGEPGVDVMAVYRVSADGQVHRVADLDHAYESLRGMIDVDGDGEPELLMGEGTTTSLIDLTGEDHGSIHVPEYHEGCGC